MLGLFGTLNLGARSLQNQQQGIETAGHNLANVNNTAYARQRVRLQTSVTIPTPIGPQGTGSDTVGIQQLRDQLLDRQIVGEASVTGYWQAQQQALEYLQSALGQQIDRQSATSTAGVSGAQGLAEGLQDLFDAFQSVATSPTSLGERQVLLQKAQTLAEKFRQVDQRLGGLQDSLNESLATDITAANRLLSSIAELNDRISRAEFNAPGAANDLRDLRQQQLEELAKLVKVSAAEDAEGNVNIAIGGVAMVTGETVETTLETYDAGGGQWLVRTAAGTAVSLGSGAAQGKIDARDGALTALRGQLDTLATQLISEVNTIHAAGFSLTGSTGAAFFTGTGAADIAVNATLLDNPALFQAAGVAGAVGNNQTALALAQLAAKPLAGLNQQTLSQNYSLAVAGLGDALASANSQVSDQQSVTEMLQRQRAAVSGVSLDEEMTEMLRYQQAFQASARLITTLDEMLDTIMGMKR